MIPVFFLPINGVKQLHYTLMASEETTFRKCIKCVNKACPKHNKLQCRQPYYSQDYETGKKRFYVYEKQDGLL